MEYRDRRSIRLKGFDYSSAGGYFITMVSFRRECLFGKIVEGERQCNSLGRIAEQCWQAIPEHFPNAGLGEYVVMPNHIHGIIFMYENVRWGTIYRAPVDRAPTIYHAPTLQFERFGKPTSGSLPTIVRTYKAAVTRRAGRELKSANIW